MKKYPLLIFCAFLLAIMGTVPVRAGNAYLSGNIGWTLSSDLNINVAPGNILITQPLKTGTSILGALGSRIDNFRVEAEVGYQPKDVDLKTANGNVHIASLLANGYYDLYTEGIQPYITGGIGVGWQTNDLYVKEDLYSGRVNKLAYQLGAGMALPISRDILIDVRYRHFATSSITEENSITYTPSINYFLFGLRVGL